MNGGEIKKSVKATFFTGLFVTFPLVLSALAVKWLFSFLDGILGGILNRYVDNAYPGLGLIVSVCLVYLVGVLATTVFGRQIIMRVEALIHKVPVMKSIYSTFKQLGDAFSPQNKAAFKEFVIVEYPRAGMHAFGFLTKECVVRDADGMEACYNTVYIPTNNLYLGDVRLFKREDVMFTGLGIEEGIKILLSAGIAAPNVIHESRNGKSPVIEDVNVYVSENT